MCTSYPGIRKHLDANNSKTCVVTGPTGSNIVCFGGRFGKQLGDGLATPDSPTPVTVINYP
jgi:hypothetical protein